MRYLHGGGGISPSFGPGIVAKGYNTVRNGYADEIACGADEVAVCTHPGDACEFAAWIVGGAREVVDALRGGHRAYRNWGPEKRLRISGLADRVEAHEWPETPLARLAAALKVRPDVVGEALTLARVCIGEAGQDGARRMKPNHEQGE